jgi:hypothetical protein
VNELIDRHVPKRVRPRVPERAVVREDLEVVVAVPAGAVERAQDLGQVGDTVARQDAIAPASRPRAPVGDVNADETVGIPLDVLDDLGRVPDVPAVELNSECGTVSILE